MTSRDKLAWAIHTFDEWTNSIVYDDAEELADYLYAIGFRWEAEEYKKETNKHTTINLDYRKAYAIFLAKREENAIKRTAREICFLLDNEEETKRKTIEKIEEKYGAGKWILTKIKSQ